VQYIHDCEYIHLDIKPANVFITFEGTLKIGDFGMATTLPVPPGLEREGDREYIAPEILELQQYDKLADVFSLGMTILETAANVCLPDNGLPWQKLRSGDLSDVPRLSSSDVEVVEENGMDVDNARPKGMEGGKLDDMVRWMLSPNPFERPSCRDILESEVVKWVDQRRRAGAVIFEGEFGPDENGIVEEKQIEAEDLQMEL
jgi:mitosis inhibitor protein kinase SWE1